MSELGQVLKSACELGTRLQSEITIVSNGDATVREHYSVQAQELNDGDSAQLLVGSLPWNAERRSLLVKCDGSAKQKAFSWRLLEPMLESNNWIKAMHGQPCTVQTKTREYEGVLEQHTAQALYLRLNDLTFVRIEQKFVRALVFTPPVHTDLLQRAANAQLLVSLSSPATDQLPVHISYSLEQTGQQNTMQFEALHELTLNATHKKMRWLSTVLVSNQTSVDYPRCQLELIERRRDRVQPQYPVEPYQHQQRQSSKKYSKSRAIPEAEVYATSMAPAPSSVQEPAIASQDSTGSHRIKIQQTTQLLAQTTNTLVLNEYRDIPCVFRSVSRALRPLADDDAARDTMRVLTWSKADQDSAMAAARSASVQLPSGYASCFRFVDSTETKTETLLESSTERYWLDTWQDQQLLRLILGAGSEVRVQRNKVGERRDQQARRSIVTMQVLCTNYSQSARIVRLEELMPQKLYPIKVLSAHDSIADQRKSLPEYQANFKTTKDAFTKRPDAETPQFEENIYLENYDGLIDHSLRSITFTMFAAHKFTPSVTVILYDVETELQD